MPPDQEDKSLMNAQEYLAYLSKKLCYKEVMQHTVESISDLMEKEGKPLVSYDGTHTSAEEVVTEGLNRPQIILDRIQSILRGSDLELHQRPVLGYLPIHNLNAVSTKAPNGEPIILLDVLLRITLHTFTSFLILFTAETGKTGNIANVPEHLRLQVFRAISASIRLFLRHEKARFDIVEVWKWMLHNVPPEIPESGDILCDVLTTFILSHEYAHHALGHIRQAAIQEYVLSEGQSPIELAASSHSREKDADQKGMDIFMKCADAGSDFLPFGAMKKYEYAPLLFFDIVSTVEATKRFRQRLLRLHPPALERKRLLLDRVLPRLKEDCREAYEFLSWVLGRCSQAIVSMNL